MLWRDLKVWQVYGANTDVGKTVISTILCRAIQKRAPAGNSLLYLKPVSTGPDGEADDRYLKKHAPGIISKCLAQFSQPLSPHLAARIDAAQGHIDISDQSLLSKIKFTLNSHVQSGGRYALVETAGGVLSPGPSGTVQADLYRPLRLPTLLVGDSKLGGIGTSISAFESLFIRGYDVEASILFEDDKWGNSDYLAEHFSQHQIPLVTLPKPPERHQSLEVDVGRMAEYYEETSSSTAVNKLLDILSNKHYSTLSKLTSMPAHAESIIWHPFRQYGLPQNVIAIDSAYGDHFQTYNQETDPLITSSQQNTSPGFNSLSNPSTAQPLLTPLFDASASWWTQGLGHGNPTLSLTAAHAAGRYGHVMFANAIHEPALDLAYNLLSTLQNPRLSRVFYTDNGSTGMEVAVKMALRASCRRYNWNKNDTSYPVGIIGIKGSYHGDTIGVMNCSEPSPFNEKVDWYQPWGHWFEPPSLLLRQGKWELTIPSEMLESPKEPTTSEFPTRHFNSLNEAFSFSSRSSDEQFYKSFITDTLTHLTKTEKKRFGALIMEPIVMGAGGQILVDPLFQRTLIKTIRENPGLIAPRSQEQSVSKSDTEWTGVPIIADEVFTGLYRLGRASSTSFLCEQSTTKSSDQRQALDPQIAPDISVHAKLLTGGLLPLAITTASESIFNTFLSDSKADALLHGHSYTAHPIGCAVANKSLDELNRMASDITRLSSDAVSLEHSRESRNGMAATHTVFNWSAYKSNWSRSIKETATISESSASHTPTKMSSSENVEIFSFFNPDTLQHISHHPRIQGCWALGTVLAMTMKPHTSSSTSDNSTSGGYTSSSAQSLQQILLRNIDPEDQSAVHSRVLGDVLYVMTSLTTNPEQMKKLERAIIQGLDLDLELSR